VEGAAGSVGAGTGDGVGLIRFGPARHVIASQKQRWTRIAG
jgi:microcompartment protein CcmK/EutM